MIRLSKEQVISIHSEMVAVYGGSAGVRDDGLLESALDSPFQTFDGNDIYPSIMQKAARLCYGIISNHPFVDGNKRTGIHLMLIFLSLNKVELAYTQQELIDLGLGIAAGNITPDELLKWVEDHS